jgi:hypothetical protein
LLSIISVNTAASSADLEGKRAVHADAY